MVMVILQIFIVCMSVMSQARLLSSSSIYQHRCEIKKVDDVNVPDSSLSSSSQCIVIERWCQCWAFSIWMQMIIYRRRLIVILVCRFCPTAGQRDEWWRLIWCSVCLLALGSVWDVDITVVKSVFHPHLPWWDSLLPLGFYSGRKLAWFLSCIFFYVFIDFYVVTFCKTRWSRFHQALETNRWS